MFINKNTLNKKILLAVIITALSCNYTSANQLISKKVKKVASNIMLGAAANFTKQKLWNKRKKTNKSQILWSSIAAGSIASILDDIIPQKIAQKYPILSNILAPQTLTVVASNYLEKPSLTSAALPITAMITGLIKWLHHPQACNQQPNYYYNHFNLTTPQILCVESNGIIKNKIRVITKSQNLQTHYKAVAIYNNIVYKLPAGLYQWEDEKIKNRPDSQGAYKPYEKNGKIYWINENINKNININKAWDESKYKDDYKNIIPKCKNLCPLKKFNSNNNISFKNQNNNSFGFNSENHYQNNDPELYNGGAFQYWE